MDVHHISRIERFNFDAQAEFTQWREAMLRAILLAFLVLGGLAAIPGIYFALEARAWSIAVGDVVALAWLGLVLGMRKTLPFVVRVWAILLIPMGLGTVFLFVLGAHGLLFLSSVPVLAALLLGWRSTLAALLLSTGLILYVGLAHGARSVAPAGPDDSMVSWGMMVVDFVLIAAVVCISTVILLRKLEWAITRAQGVQYDLKQLALYDSLTQLPNRRCFVDSLARAIRQSERSQVHGAVMFIDLDNFKNVNDTRGHNEGDVFLIAASQRLAAQLRGGDILARLGGDEFVVLLSELPSGLAEASRGALATAERLRQAMHAPIDLGAGAFVSTISVGVTMFPRSGQSVEDLLREADIAMYTAKAGGRDRVAFFESAMQSELQERLQMERELGQAMANDELAIAVQAQVDAAGRCVGAEVLLRWNSPTRGAVPPARFIALAEETGQIVAMGEWVLVQACLLVRRLRALGHGFPVSVNISPRQFYQDGFVERVRAVLAEQGTAASDLIFEVTEGLMIEDMVDTVARMHELVDLGIRFSVDDFGTGYSSLSYLKRLPLYELKIDRIFVKETPTDPNDTAIVRMVLSVAAALRLTVVAEGVETVAQADFLVANGCDRLQGYLYSRPGSVDDFILQLGTPAAELPQGAGVLG